VLTTNSKSFRKAEAKAPKENRQSQRAKPVATVHKYATTPPKKSQSRNVIFILTVQHRAAAPTPPLPPFSCPPKTLFGKKTSPVVANGGKMM